jgi:hypothetical protein
MSAAELSAACTCRAALTCSTSTGWRNLFTEITTRHRSRPCAACGAPMRSSSRALCHDCATDRQARVIDGLLEAVADLQHELEAVHGMADEARTAWRAA